MHCVALGESFQTQIYLQNLASIEPRTSLVKFAAPRDVTGHTVPSTIGRWLPAANQLPPEPQPEARVGTTCWRFMVKYIHVEEIKKYEREYR